MKQRSIHLLLLFCSTLLTSISQAPASLQAMQRGAVPSTAPVLAVAFGPDSRFLASGDAAGMVRVWSLRNNAEVWSKRGHDGPPITGIAYSLSGTILATVSENSQLKVWNPATGAQGKVRNAHAEGVTALVVSPDGKSIFTGGLDTKIRAWNVATGEMRTFGGNDFDNRGFQDGHTDGVTSLALSPDGSKLISGGLDKRFIIWDVNTGRELANQGGHQAGITSVAYNPSGLLPLAASADSNGAIHLWDMAADTQYPNVVNAEVEDVAAKAVTTLAFSPDGTTLAAGRENKTIALWATQDLLGSREQIVVRTLTGYTSAVTTIAYSRDGKNLAGGSGDGKIIVFDPVTGIPRVTLQGTTTSTVKTTSRNSAGVSTLAAAGESSASTMSANVAAAPDQGQGTNPPILVLSTTSDKFGRYYAEILRAEGLNAFDVKDIETIADLPATLSNYDGVVLGRMVLGADQVTSLTNWVNGGGNLIAMRPDKQLAGLLGLTDAGATLTDGYLLVDTSKAPGAGIVNQTIQFHETADRYMLNGASGVATLYSTASSATTSPAVSLRGVGANGGQAAAFTYDLARSIVYMRQGNPAWAAQERDGFSPIRSDDKYYGAKTGDVKPDWIDLNKVGVPQVDEQQRLLANLILEMNRDKKPLPRFWYLPFGKKAAVILSGDDHAIGGTASRFDQHKAASPSGCNAALWECVRSTSYIYPDSPLTAAQAAAYDAEGFEIGMHPSTNCQDFTPASLNDAFTTQIAGWKSKYGGITAPATNRTHCIAFSDWASTPKVELSNGIRLDTTYYYWPSNFVNNRPGYMTGSATPMRFADLDGTLIDVYQAATQLTDESGQAYPFSINTMLDWAVGVEGYYGVFTVNAHTDNPLSDVSDEVVLSAKNRGIPVVAARQMLTWLDGRNNSSFGSPQWTAIPGGGALGFTVAVGAGSTGIQAMLPTSSAGGLMTGITRDGSPIPYQTQAIKGIDYAFFAADAGSYVATYGVDTTPPAVTSTAPSANATGVNPGTSVKASFSETMDPATISSSTVELRDGANNLVAATVSYDAATRSAILQPSSTLNFLTTYTALVRGGPSDPRVKDMSGNALGSDYTWSFTTKQAPQCPCSVWSSTDTPGNPSVADPNAVELGMKFRSDTDGYITGIRFYKGAGNTGPHIGNLWTTTGQQLATAAFGVETATGWQQVDFASPVPITANTTYVASYHTSSGNYAGDNNFFAAAGVSKEPLTALQDGVEGGNGLYAYGASQFPSNSFRSSNYWVDVVFTTGGAPPPPPPGAPVANNDSFTVDEDQQLTVPARGVLSNDTDSDTDINVLTAAKVSDPVNGAVTLNADGSFTYTPNPNYSGTDSFTYRANDGQSNSNVATVAITINPFNDAPLANDDSYSAYPGQALTVPVPGLLGNDIDLDGNTLSAIKVSDPSQGTVSVNGDGSFTYTPNANATGTDSLTYRTSDGQVESNVATVSIAISTEPPPACPCSIWSESATPAVIEDNDKKSVELGVRFRSNVAGYITGIRFYKGSQNAGPHSGTLWNSSGQQLATATFSNETVSGWQQVTFATPVPITPNTTYVASYHAPVGRYSTSESYFTSAGIDNGPLRALRSGEDGPNGVYIYSNTTTFPTTADKATNYWVDVVFTTGTSGN